MNEKAGTYRQFNDAEIRAERERERQLTDAFKMFAQQNGFLVDPDGCLRMKQWGDALAFQELAREHGLEVEVREPNMQDRKAKIWLAEYFRIRPIRKI